MPNIKSVELINKKELYDALDPFCRIMIINNKLPLDYRDTNQTEDTPLRDIFPGSWPKLKDLQKLYDFAIKHGYKMENK